MYDLRRASALSFPGQCRACLLYTSVSDETAYRKYLAGDEAAAQLLVERYGMTRARAKLLQAKVNSLLSLCDFDTPLDGLLLHNHALCIIRYEDKNPQDGGAPADKTKNSLSPAVLPAPDPVLPLGGTTAKCYCQQQKDPELPKNSLSLAVLPAPDPVLPGCGTTAPCYRHQQKAPAQVPG